MHHESRGRKLTTAAMQDLSRRYKTLSPQEKAFFSSMGATATNNRKAGIATFPTHSRRSKVARAHHSQGSVSASSVAPAPAPQPPPPPLDPNAAHTLELLESGNMAELSSSQLAAVSNLTASEDPEVCAMVSLDFVRAAIRIYSKVYRQERKQKRIQDKDRGVHLSQHCYSQAVQELQQRRRLTSVPFSSWSSLPFACPVLSCALQLDQLPSVARPSPEHADSATALAADWDAKHIGVQQSSWGVVERKAPVRPCLSFGVCVCRGLGRHLFTIKNNITKYLKDMALQPGFQTALSSGFVVLHWQIQALLGGSSEASDAVQCHHHFTHIGMLYQKPYRITLVHMQIANGVAPPEVRPAADTAHPQHARLILQYAGHDDSIDVDTLLRFLLTVDLDMMISIEPWLLSSRMTPVASLNTVHAQQADSGRCVWRGLSQETSRRRRQRPAHEVLEGVMASSQRRAQKRRRARLDTGLENAIPAAEPLLEPSDAEESSGSDVIAVPEVPETEVWEDDAEPLEADANSGRIAQSAGTPCRVGSRSCSPAAAASFRCATT